MGNPNSKASGNRFGIAGPADNPDPHVARAAALRDAAEFGMIGLLNSGAGGDPNAPTAPWGRDDSLGNDPMSARGNMWGDSIGDSFGAGGLGLSGIGEGGGGRGEGIGLGSIGTIGHGAGTGTGAGTRRRRRAVLAAPTPLGAGHVDEEAAKRIVDVFLATACTAERHLKRVAMIREMEKERGMSELSAEDVERIAAKVKEMLGKGGGARASEPAMTPEKVAPWPTGTLNGTH